jgi:hypothetical protein
MARLTFNQSSPNWHNTIIKGWAVLEWECCIKHPEQGAEEGAPFIKDHIIRVTEKAFDDFASTGKNPTLNKKVLGLS